MLELALRSVPTNLLGVLLLSSYVLIEWLGLRSCNIVSEPSRLSTSGGMGKARGPYIRCQFNVFVSVISAIPMLLISSFVRYVTAEWTISAAR